MSLTKSPPTFLMRLLSENVEGDLKRFHASSLERKPSVAPGGTTPSAAAHGQVWPVFNSPASLPHAGLIGRADGGAPVSVTLFVLVAMAGDFMALLASQAMAYAMAGEGTVADAGHGGWAASAAFQAATTAVSMAVIVQLNGYAPGKLHNARHRLRAVLMALMVGIAATVAVPLMQATAWHSQFALPCLWIIVGTAAATVSVAFTAQLARSPVNAPWLTRRVAVIGVNGRAQSVIDQIHRDPEKSETFIGLYDDGAESMPIEMAGHPVLDLVLGTVDDLVSRSRRQRIDAIILAMPRADDERVMRLRETLGSVVADIYITASPEAGLHGDPTVTERLGGNSVIKIGSRPLTARQGFLKAVFDWAAAAGLLIAALPFLALVAIAIRIGSKGPVLFRQPRLGFNNTMFNVYKFRTMYHHMVDMHADRQTTRGDPRVTRLGYWLRKTGLDEVPQILNVLRGEMSLVGPRPHAINTKAAGTLFHDAVADYARRHRVKPGITGWAQVNGWRGETQTIVQLEQRVAHDLYYIDNWSLFFDFKIIVLTALRELNSKVAF